MLRRLAVLIALAAAMMVEAPPALAQDARDIEVCRQQCMARARDASDPRYRSCVASVCEGRAVRRTTPTPRRTTAPAEAPAAPVGQWAMDTHPALGVGLRIQTEQGVLGLACVPEGVALRATNGLFRGPTLGWVTDNGGAGGMVALTPGAAYSETSANACAMGVAGMASAVSLVLVDAPVTGLGRGRGYVLNVDGTEVPVMSGSEIIARFPGARVVPAQGLAAGLGALAASCPAIAEAMRSPCP